MQPAVGTAAPTDQERTGDFFLNTSTFDIYNKASGTWSKKGNIKGATGATGTPEKMALMVRRELMVRWSNLAIRSRSTKQSRKDRRLLFGYFDF